jgi:Dolichyl-phosphate-mannose-protein mannosyltransferase
MEASFCVSALNWALRRGMPEHRSNDLVTYSSPLHQNSRPSDASSKGRTLVLLLALVKLCIHLVTNLNGGYGFFRDELYYLACSDHMAWGYVDHPPLSVAALWFIRLIAGDSLFVVRLLPALSGAAVVYLTGTLTRELGGKTFAQVLACLCVMASPLVLGMDSVFSMNSFDILFWTLSFLLIVLALNRDRERYWIYLGLILGLGLLNKISVLWLGAGLVVGLLLTPDRRLVLRRRVWAAGLIAALMFLPYVLWQFATGFPTLEFIKNAGSGKYVSLSALDLIVQQALFMNPLAFPVWAGGVAYFLLSRSTKRFRILPAIYLVVFLILAMNRDVKAAYLVPVIPMLFAAGGVAVEVFVEMRGLRWLRIALPAVVFIGGMFLAPFVMPVLPVETYIGYAKALGVAPATSEKNAIGRLPQHFADMFGWPEMAAAVADVYRSLTPEERAKCVILCNNYGEAGAIDFFGRKYGLPHAISGHNNYWLWGPRGASGEIVIRLGGSEERILWSYASAARVGMIKNEYSMPYESNLPIWVCRSRRVPLSADWMDFKVFN